jgi:hypothetical protein
MLLRGFLAAAAAAAILLFPFGLEHERDGRSTEK